MSNLYSLLKQSIIERNLRSPAARKEIYGQARTAMIRQLWTYDPPLAEAEIEDRIGHFDKAVAEIEDDLVLAFAEGPPKPPGRETPRRAARGAAPVYEGYDETADYAPTFGGRPELPPEDDRGRASEPPGPEDAEAIDEIEEALHHRSAAIERALRADLDAPARAGDGPDDDDEDIQVERAPEPQEQPPDGAFADHVFASYTETREDYADEDEEEAPLRTRKARRSWRDLPERSRVAILLSAIGALAVVLIGLGVYLLLPSGAAPPAGSGAVTANPSGGPASGGPAQPAGVVASYVVFDGRDPTVFEASSGNPIRFEGDAGGGFARVSSSAADAGVRATIGPGLANRLAGRNIRLTLVARSARENGAVSFRFAYQSGVAFSHWQTVNLSPDFAVLNLDWRVPTQRTDPDGDHILIEPGIPGDGTGVDIKSIRIDLLG